MAAEGKGKSWVVEIDDQLENMDEDHTAQRRKQSIYKVPACIKELNKNGYKPQVVSFGPYHHGERDVVPMEEHKHRALLHFLKRSRKPLREFVAAMEEVVQQLQDAYRSLDEQWRDNKDRFMKMMILDGCFMLEIMRVFHIITLDGNDRGASKLGFELDDPIFSGHGILYVAPFIRRDMFMIENQLPLLVLHKLIFVENRIFEKHDHYLNELVFHFCASPNAKMPKPEDGLGLHPLAVLHTSLVTTSVKCRPSKNGFSSGIIQSATELHDAGVHFEKSKTEGHEGSVGGLRDIRFERGILSLPEITIDDATEHMFLNLMAYERLHFGTGNDVASYVFFMENIIDTEADVGLLRSKEIIKNAIGSDKAVVQMFNRLSKDAVLDPSSCLGEVHDEVNEYSRKTWHKWWAAFKHTYFRSPWSLISLIAAFILLVLTVMQTIYSAMQVYH